MRGMPARGGAEPLPPSSRWGSAAAAVAAAAVAAAGGRAAGSHAPDGAAARDAEARGEQRQDRGCVQQHRRAAAQQAGHNEQHPGQPAPLQPRAKQHDGRIDTPPLDLKLRLAALAGAHAGACVEAVAAFNNNISGYYVRIDGSWDSLKTVRKKNDDFN